MIPNIDVAIIGAGPCGLAAATELKRLGLNNVVVFERESEPGGIPRHCGHPPFGAREFKRIYAGPRYAHKLANRAIKHGVDIQTAVTVVSLHEGGSLTLSSNAGVFQVEAKRVLLCTGIRETPRSARLVSGSRAAGIMTTGALQSMVYLKNRQPCHHPLIVGTELVAFSALLTCRHAGIKPIAMIEPNSRITAYKGSEILSRLLGVPLKLNTEIVGISGNGRVQSIQIRNKNEQSESMACDSVVFSGQFTPEASLCRSSHLEMDAATEGPLVDQFGRCSDDTFYAAGNLLRAVETAGWCWKEGVRVASIIVNDLQRPSEINQQVTTRINIASSFIKYVMPGCLSQSLDATHGINPTKLQIGLTQPAKGTLQLRLGQEVMASREINSLPERRILLSLNKLRVLDGSEPLTLTFQERCQLAP